MFEMFSILPALKYEGNRIQSEQVAGMQSSCSQSDSSQLACKNFSIMSKKISRKKFIKQSSLGVLGTGIMINAGRGVFTPPAPLMKNMLGNTGIELTGLGFGATRTDQPAVLKYALSKGITLIDTGRHYAQGRNEEMVGSLIKDIRKDVVIQSKVSSNFGDNILDLPEPEMSAIIAEKFWKSLHDSLKVLQTDYIDILLLHSISEPELVFHPVVTKLFTEAKKQGKILARGFSTHSMQAELFRKNTAEGHYDVVMTAFNHAGGYVHASSGRKDSWNQDELISELEAASAAGTGIIAMKTCSGGPYAGVPGTEATIPQAVKWVLEREYVHSSAVAMANFREIDEHVSLQL